MAHKETRNYRKKKIVVAGEDKAGKTELISSLLRLGASRYGGQISVVDDPFIKSLNTDDDPEDTAAHSSTLEFWEDTYNPSSHRLQPLYYREVDVAIICFALDSMYDHPSETFEVLERRVKGALYLSGRGHEDASEANRPLLFLIGCRKDLLPSNKPFRHLTAFPELFASGSKMKRYVTKFDLQKDISGYFECSTKTEEGLSEILDHIIKAMPKSLKKPHRWRRGQCILL